MLLVNMAGMDRLARFWKVALLVALVALLLISAAGCVISSGGAESKVNWLYNTDDALSRAQSENKPIMIDFYADWCTWCKRLDSDTYSDDNLSAFLNESFICLKSNTQKSDLYGRYGITALPTIVFLSPQGTEIGERIPGYQPPAQFYQSVQAVLSQWSSQR